MSYEISVDGVTQITVSATSVEFAAGVTLDMDFEDYALVTAVGADKILIRDATDGQLKSALASDLTGGDAVTLAGAYDYLTISGQEITRGQVDLTTDVTGVLPIANVATGTPDGTKYVRDDGTLATPGGAGDMSAATYDPTSVVGDVFLMSNMVEAANAKVLTAAERTKLGYITITQAVNLDTLEANNTTDVTLAGSLDYITRSGQVLTRNPIDVTTDISGVVPVANLGTGSPSGSNFLRGDGAWAVPAGSGDMLAATYDPTTVAGDAFDMDNMVEGTDTKVFTADERAKLTLIEAQADVTDATNVAAAGAVMDSDISAAEGFVRKTGAGAYEGLKSNLSASAAPTTGDDTGDGYAVGSVWIDTTADEYYICVDATLGAAVWLNPSSGVTNLGDTATSTTVTITSSSGADTTLTAADGANAGVMTAAMFTKLDGVEAGAEVNPSHFRPYDVSEYFTGSAAYGSSGDESDNFSALQTALSQSFAASGNRLAYVTITDHLKVNAESGNFIDDGGFNKRIPVIIDGLGSGHLEMVGTATALKMYSSDDMDPHSDLAAGLIDIDGATNWTTLPPAAGPIAPYYKNQHFRVQRLTVTSSGGDCIHICEGRAHNRAWLSDLFLRTAAINKVALRVDTDCFDLHADNIRIDDCPKTAVSVTGNNLYFNRLNVFNCGMITYGTARTGLASGTSQIQLASDAPSVDLTGFQIALTDGTSSGDYTPVVQTYNTSTKLATVSPAFTSQPDATTKYEVSTIDDPAVYWNTNGSTMVASHIENNMGLGIEVAGDRNIIEGWFEDNNHGVEHVYDGTTSGPLVPSVKNSGFWNEFRNFNWPTSSDQIISNDTEFVFCDGGPEYATMGLLHNRGQAIDIKGMAAYASGTDEGRAYWSLETLETAADDITRSNMDSTETANSYAVFNGHTIKCKIIAADQQYTNRWIFPFDASPGIGSAALSIPQDAMVYAKVRYSLDSAGATYFAGRRRKLLNRVFELQYRFGTTYYLRRFAYAYCDGVHEVTAIGQCDAHTVTTGDFGLRMTHGDDSGNPAYYVTIHSIELAFSYPST